jgi:DNA-binding beta-propeller fold protein YncE
VWVTVFVVATIGLIGGAGTAFGDADACPSDGSKTLMLADGSNTEAGFGCGYLDNWENHSIGGWATQFWASYPALGYKYDYICDHQTGDVNIIKVTTQGNFTTVDGKQVPLSAGSVTYTASNSASSTRHWGVGVIWNTGNPHDGTLPAPGTPPPINLTDTSKNLSYTKTCNSGEIPSYVNYQSGVTLLAHASSVAAGKPLTVPFTTQVVSKGTLPNGQTMVLQWKTVDSSGKPVLDSSGSQVWTSIGKTLTADTTLGALSPLGCVVDTGKSTCSTTQAGLSGVYGIAVSPDGKSAYAASTDDNALVAFARDPSTYVLTPQGCIGDSGTGSCPATAAGLDGAKGVAISPDGKNVYTASSGDNAVAVFARDPSTGALTPKGCIVDSGQSSCAATQQGLSDVRAIVVSPDGKNVYTASSDDDAVAIFARDPSTGALTPKSCVGDAGSSKCPTTAQGLNGATGIAISPDGASVYVVGGDADAIVTFARDPSTGALASQGCFEDAGQDHCPTTQGLDGADGVTVSPNGRSVYVVSYADDALVRFDRDVTTGALTPRGCIGDAGQSNCGPTAQGLGDAVAVAVAPDGASVYVTGNDDSDIARFDRDTSTGALTSHGCFSDTGQSICGATTAGLGGARALAPSADGKSLYAVASGDNTVVSLGIYTPAPGQPTSNTGGGVLGWVPGTPAPAGATYWPSGAPGKYTLRVVYPGINVTSSDRGYTPFATDPFDVTVTAPATSRRARVAAPWPAAPVAAAARTNDPNNGRGATPPPPQEPMLGAIETSPGGLATVNSRFVVPERNTIPSSYTKIACPKAYGLLNVEASSTGNGAPADGITIGSSSNEGATLTFAESARGHNAMAQALCRRGTARRVLRSRGFAYGTIRDDRIRLIARERAVLGGLGSDHIVVSGAGSSAHGGLGDDRIVLRAGKTSANAGFGDDIVWSVARRRTLLVGGPGRDRLIGARGRTLINAIDGSGGDTVICHSSRNRVAADAGDRIVGPCQEVTLR